MSSGRLVVRGSGSTKPAGAAGLSCGMVPYLSRTGDRSSCRGSISIVELGVIVLLLALMTYLGVSQVNAIRERSRIAKCVGNLRQIVVLMKLYRTEFRRYPTTALDDFRPLADLTEDYGMFVCPSSGKQLASAQDLNGKTSYKFFGTLEDVERFYAGSEGGGNDGGGGGSGGSNGDGDGDGSEEKVTICHIPPGNPDNAHTITISRSALDAHLAHGDTIGECEESPGKGKGKGKGSDKKVTICHIPPGNPDNAHTITISESALDSHLAHGDTIGDCGSDSGTGGSGGSGGSEEVPSGVFSPSDPRSTWDTSRQFGAVYDRSYSNHGETLNIVYLDTGQWESLSNRP